MLLKTLSKFVLDSILCTDSSMCHYFDTPVDDNMHNNGFMFGNKSELNMAHTTDILSKDRCLPRWEVSTHTLQFQGQFVVVKNRQMSNGALNIYSSVCDE